MAVVAFPFASCITSEDVDENKLYDAFALSEENSDNETGAEEDTQMDDRPEDDDDATVASACLAPSVPPLRSVEDKTQESNDSHQHIDDLSSEHLNEDDNHSENMDVDVNVPTNAAYGGLHNLGNTCYLASALQMLNSLDHFIELLKSTPLPTQEEADSSSDSPNKTLRDALLEITENLRRGENVSPDEFKRILDGRTPLFVGFRQQDSHELLSSLLELLDEDYKKKPEELKTNQEDQLKSGEKKAEEEQQSSSSQLQNEMDIEAETPSSTTLDADTPEYYESAAKKPRSVNSGEPSIGDAEYSQQSRCQSFSELKPEGIEELLHGEPSATKFPESAIAPLSPRCKLFGGRMTAPDVLAYMTLDDTDYSTTAVAQKCENSEGSTVECTVSPIDTYLRTEVRVRLTCDSCKYTRTHLENFLHLSLEIGSDSGSVADGLRKFFSPEKREVKCEKCFCETAQQTMEITRLPRALLLHLKRFIVDVSPDYTSVSYRKNQSDVVFEETFVLNEDQGSVLKDFLAHDVSMPGPVVESSSGTSAEQSYQIRSVVNHIGSSASCGHYTADALRLYPDGKRAWTSFNDTYVSFVSPEEAIRDSSRTAYMIMYELA